MTAVIPLAGVQAFVAVVRAGSFVGAASALDLSTPAVSRSIARLERALGVRLLQRTTRKVSLTDEGRAYHAHCSRLLEGFAEASDSVKLGRALPQGRLRVDVPMSLGRLVLLPALPAFLAANPALALQFGMSDRLVDLLEEGVDAAVRIGELVDSGLVAQRVGQTRWVTAAAPSYLAGRPRPTRPRDLARMDCIGFFYPSTGKPRTWEFLRKGVREVFEPEARVVIGNAEATVDAAVQGMGVVHTLDFLVEPAIREGKLARVLTGWEAPGPPISVVYPSNRYLSARVRVFADFVKQVLASSP